MKKFWIIALLVVIFSSIGGAIPSFTYADEDEAAQADETLQESETEETEMQENEAQETETEQTEAQETDLINQAVSEVKDDIVLCVDCSKVYVNGRQGRIDPKQIEITPFVEGGNTFVPLKFLSEQLGGKISWNSKTKETTISFNGNTARTKLGDPNLYVNERKVTMSASGKTVNGTTYLPLRNVVEDVFQKKLFYKDGIIIISSEAKTFSSSTLAVLSKTLKPYVVYTGGKNLIYVYADGTSETKKIKFKDAENPIVAGTGEGFFYIEDHKRTDTINGFYHKVDLQGNVLKTIKIYKNNLMSFGLAKGDIQYYSSHKEIYQIKENDISNPKLFGKGDFIGEDAFLDGETLWFTNTADDYAIYKLQNGKRTKISNDKSHLKYVQGNWIYYGYFENERWTLYRMTKDGKQKTKLTGNADVGDSAIYNQKIYYLDDNSKVLREMNLDGSNKRVVCKLSRPSVSILEFQGGNIFFTEDNQSKGTQTLYKVNLSTGMKQQVIHTALDYQWGWKRIDKVSSLGGVVYYSIEGTLYAIDSVGSKPREIADDSGWGRLQKLKVE